MYHLSLTFPWWLLSNKVLLYCRHVEDNCLYYCSHYCYCSVNGFYCSTIWIICGEENVITCGDSTFLYELYWNIWLLEAPGIFFYFFFCLGSLYIFATELHVLYVRIQFYMSVRRGEKERIPSESLPIKLPFCVCLPFLLSGLTLSITCGASDKQLQNLPWYNLFHSGTPPISQPQLTPTSAAIFISLKPICHSFWSWKTE